MAGTYTQTIETATPAETLLEELRATSASLAALTARMDAAMTAIAEEAGAWRCDYCGSWTLEVVAVELEDTDGRIWSAVEQCPRCAGER